MGSAPPPTSTPISSQPQDLARLYSPVTKTGGIYKVIEDRKRLINRKK